MKKGEARGVQRHSQLSCSQVHVVGAESCSQVHVVRAESCSQVHVVGAESCSQVHVVQDDAESGDSSRYFW